MSGSISASPCSLGSRPSFSCGCTMRAELNYPRTALRRGIARRRNCPRPVTPAPPHLGAPPLHHPPVELARAARGVFGLLECRDDLARFRDLFRRRREDRVAGHDMAWMDQRLAVETEVARLRAFQRKAVDIAD